MYQGEQVLYNTPEILRSSPWLSLQILAIQTLFHALDLEYEKDLRFGDQTARTYP